MMTRKKLMIFMNLKEKLTACMEDAIAREEVAGASMLVLRHGAEVVYAAAGMADREAGKPMARDTIHRLFSQSKPITAAAVMLLVERGEIDLCAPVESFLPGFKNQQVLTESGLEPARRQATVMDLLGMTAGLCYPGDDPAGRAAAALFAENDARVLRGEGMSTLELCNRMGQLPLAFHPGEHFRYSTCADVLGAVVEVAGKKPFARFLEEEIFQPLGMKDTAFWVPAEKRGRFAQAYIQPGALRPYRQTHLEVGDYDREPVFASGGAGLVSTLDDYAAFATMLLEGGRYPGGQLFQPETVRFLTSPQLGPQLLADVWNSLDGFSYGKLMRVMRDPGRYPGLSRMDEYGWDGWLGTYFANFPHEQMTMLMMTQRTDHGTGPLTRKLRNLLLSSPEARL